MATLGELVVNLKAETAQFTRAMQDVRKETKSIHAGMHAMGQTVKGAVAGFLTLDAAVRALHAVVDATTEAEQAQYRLEAVLRATNNAAGLTADQISDLASRMQEHTLFDDEQIKNAAAALATFSNVSGETFRDAIKLGADLSTVFGGDLQDNILKLGKALDSPLEGIDALSRIGVRFNETERETIKNLLEHNRLADAQAVVIEKVKGKVDGAAEALGDRGLAGAIATAKHAWGEFLEAVGNAGEGDGWVAEWAKRSKDRAEFWRKMFLPKGTREQIEEDIKDLQKKIADTNATSDFWMPSDAKVHWIEQYQAQIDVLATRLAAFDAQQEKAETRATQGAKATAPGETPEARALREKRAKEALARADKSNADAIDEYSRAAAEYQRQYEESTRAATDAVEDQLRAVQDAIKVQEELNAASREVDMARVEARIQDETRAAEEAERVWNHAVQNISDDFASVFSDALTGQIHNFREFCLDILRLWARTMAQMAAADASTSLFSGLLQSGAGLTLPSGGPTPFPGFDVPAPAMSAAAPVVVQFNVQAIDSASFAQTLDQHGATLTAIVARGVARSRSAQRAFARGAN